MRRIAGVAGGCAFAVAFTAVLLEAVLRLAPGLLPPRLGNAVYSVYGDGPGDIYWRDRPTHMVFMHPAFEAVAYWNGYVWHHRTDGWGHRNPPDVAKDWLLLGDSMIYGHGVEEEQTLAHFLRASHGIGAYNMGRQADSLFEEYVRARLYLPHFRPGTVVLFVFLNDFDDLHTTHTPEEIADPPALRFDYDALFARVQRPALRFRLREQPRRSKAWRLAAGLGELARTRVLDPPQTDGLPRFLAMIEDPERFAPLADYYRRLLSDLAVHVAGAGASLFVVQLDVAGEVFGAQALAPQDRVHALLTQIGAAAEFPVLTTRGIFDGCPTCFLPQDGHLTEQGHRRLAAWLARAVPRPR